MGYQISCKFIKQCFKMSYLSAGVAVDLVLDPFAGQGQRKLERLNAAGCAA